MSSSTLEQVIDGRADHHSLTAGVHGKSPDFHSVSAGDVLYQRRLANNLDKLFAGITVLVDVADVPRRHLLVQRHADGVLRRMSFISGEDT